MLEQRRAPSKRCRDSLNSRDSGRPSPDQRPDIRKPSIDYVRLQKPGRDVIPRALHATAPNREALQHLCVGEEPLAVALAAPRPDPLELFISSAFSLRLRGVEADNFSHYNLRMILRRKRAATLSLAVAAFLALCPLASRGEIALRTQDRRALLLPAGSGIDTVGAPSRPSGVGSVRRTEGTRSNDSTAFERHWVKPCAVFGFGPSRDATPIAAAPNRSTGVYPDTGPRLARAPPSLGAEARG
jgi:hypothetical protein